MSESPSATPTPTDPAAPEDPADPSTWIIDFDGVGPIAVGSDVATVRASIQRYEDVTQTDVCPWTAMFDSAAYPSVWLSLDSPAYATVESVFLTNGASTAGHPETSPKTAEGVGLGAAEAAVQSAYPEATTTELQGGRQGYSVTDGSRWFAISVLDCTVDTVFVGDTQTAPSEFCG